MTKRIWDMLTFDQFMTNQDKKDKEKFLKNFGENIRTLRKAKGMTGAELARKCFMEKQNILKLEKGQFNPSIYYLKKIAEGLEVEFHELFKGIKQL